MAAFVLLAGACRPSTGTPTAAPTPGASSAGGATASTTTVCAAFGRAKEEFTASAVASVGSGDANKKLVEALTRFSASIRAQVPVAADPAVRTALQETAAAADAYAAAPDPSQADGGAFEKAGTTLDKLCEAPATADPSGAAVASGQTIGAKGTGCELPVSFEPAKSWRVKAVTVAADSPLADSLRKGPLSVVCEVNGEPAGHLGYLRVWAGAGATGPLRESLKTVLTGGDVRKVGYADVTVGGRPAVEATYEQYSQLTEQTRKQRAFAVQTDRGAVVVTLGGLDAENDAIVAAYELAKRTLTGNR